MSYKVLEHHVKYEDGKLEMVAVLWYSNEELGWVRASYCTSTPCGGYHFLMPTNKLSPELIQTVAGYGMNLPDDMKRKLFPGKRLWER